MIACSLLAHQPFQTHEQNLLAVKMKENNEAASFKVYPADSVHNINLKKEKMQVKSSSEHMSLDYKFFY